MSSGRMARQTEQAYCPMIDAGRSCCAAMFTLGKAADAVKFCVGSFEACTTYQRLAREIDRDPIPIHVCASVAGRFLDAAGRSVHPAGASAGDDQRQAPLRRTGT